MQVNQNTIRGVYAGHKSYDACKWLIRRGKFVQSQLEYRIMHREAVSVRTSDRVSEHTTILENLVAVRGTDAESICKYIKADCAG